MLKNVVGEDQIEALFANDFELLKRNRLKPYVGAELLIKKARDSRIEVPPTVSWIQRDNVVTQRGEKYSSNS